MTPTSRRVKNLLAIALLNCFLLPTLAHAQEDEQARVWRTVEQFFATFEQKDLPKVFAFWSEKSEDLAAKQSILQMFVSYRTIEVKNLRSTKIAVENDKATVQFVAEVTATGAQQGTNITLSRAHKTIQMVKEKDAWKVWKYITAEDELAVSLSAVKTPEEAGALLNAQPESVTPDLIRSLTREAMGLFARGKQAEGFTINDLALSIAQRLNDKTGMALALRVKGIFFQERGDYKQALEYLDQTLKLSQELEQKSNIADALNSIAIVYARQSDFPNALTMFQRSLQIKQELGNKLDVARELGNIGNIYMSQGEKVRALDHFERSLKLHEEMGHKGSISAVLNSIGVLYHQQGNYAQALEYYQRSLKIKQEIGDKLGVARALNNIGILYSEQGQYVQALDYLQQNAKIREELGDKPGEVEALHSIAGAYLFKGDYAQALAYEQRALKPAEALANNELLGEILQTIGECHLRMGQHQAASEYAERAASLAERLGTLEVLWKAQNTAGQAHLALNQPELAHADFLESIATIEKLRGRVAGGEQEQQRFFENKIAPYQSMVQLLLARNKPIEALSYAERAKGRVLLDVLNRGRDDITKGMTSEELKRDRDLSTEIATLNTALARSKAQSKPNETQITELQTRLDKLRLEYEAFQASLYVVHPELKVQRGQTQMLTLDQTAALLPDDRTAILEYIVTEDKSYLFVLRKAATKVDLTVHTLNLKSSDLATMAESFRQRVAERDLTIKQPARQLYDLLIKPAEEKLAGVRKLCIVPDGALWNVPFQALHAEKGYLLEEYAVFYAPSLSVLREMGKRAHALRTAHRQTINRAGLLAMGNPALNGETAASARFARRDEPLSPLPDAEKEVNSLGRLYGPDNSRVLIGGEAREAVVKSDAGKYEVLHFATHATLDDRNPLYSRIILSRTDADVQEDGLLEAWEIMKLDLNAALIVLSACETARGRVVAGEGMIGVSWALFVAGSPSAVVSQWKVDSARTSELMIEFHRNWLRKRGTKSEALRQASLKLLRGPYNHPAYWAGFVLIGDDN